MPQSARYAQSPATPNRSPWPASPRPTTARCRQSEAEIDALLLLVPARSPPPSGSTLLRAIGMAQGRAQLLDIGGKSRFTIPIRSAVHSRLPKPGKTAKKLRHLEAAI